MNNRDKEVTIVKVNVVFLLIIAISCGALSFLVMGFVANTFLVFFFLGWDAGVLFWNYETIK